MTVTCLLPPPADRLRRVVGDGDGADRLRRVVGDGDGEGEGDLQYEQPPQLLAMSPGGQWRWPCLDRSSRHHDLQVPELERRRRVGEGEGDGDLQ